MFTLLFLSTGLMAQTKEVQLTSSGGKLYPILDLESKVKGYFMLYYRDKKDAKNESYALEFLDDQLNTVKKTSVVIQENSSFLGSVFNDSTIYLSFVDIKQKKISVKAYSQNGERAGGYSITEIPKMLLRSLTMNQGQMADAMLTPIPGKGLVLNSPEKNEKIGYDLVFLDNNCKKVWTFGSDPKSEFLEAATNFAVTNEVFSFVSIKKKNVFSKKFDKFLIGLNVKTGKKIFETQLADNGFEPSPVTTTFDPATNDLIVIGDYREEDSKETSKALGMYIGRFNSTTGASVAQKFFSFEKDLAKFMTIKNDNGKMENNSFLFVHEAIMLKNGKIFIIGEQYKKVVDGVGLAFRVLGAGAGAGAGAASNGAIGVSGGGGGATKFVLLNLVCMEFDKDFNIKDVKTFEKEKESIGLPAGYDFASGSMVAYIMKSLGLFDFVYAKKSTDKNGFQIVYTKQKGSGKKAKHIVGGVNYSNGTFTEDIIETPTKEVIQISTTHANDNKVLIYQTVRGEKKSYIWKAEVAKFNK